MTEREREKGGPREREEGRKGGWGTEREGEVCEKGARMAIERKGRGYVAARAT